MKQILCKIFLNIAWKLSDDAMRTIIFLNEEYPTVPKDLQHVKAWKWTYWVFDKKDSKKVREWLDRSPN